MLRLKRRQIIRVISFACAVLVIAAAACFAGFSAANRYRDTIQQSYRMELSELSDYITNIKSDLSKWLYANTGTARLSLAAKLNSDCTGAKQALSRLPVSAEESEHIQKFLSQAGDFSGSMINSAARGYEFSSQSRQSLKALSEYADNIAPLIEDLSAKYSDSDVPLITGQTVNSGNLSSYSEGLALDNDFTEMNKGFTSYPTLIYDGPFADSTQNRKSIYLETSAECSEGDARKKAAEFLSVSADSLKTLEPINGKLPAYAFLYGENEYITVTRQGCRILEMSGAEPQTSKRLDYDKALKIAKEFLKKNKIRSMKESYYAINNNICVINFAYSQDGVICYPDLIKVGVSLESGDIVSYNAENYLMNHSTRQTEPYLTPASAQLNLSPYLSVKKTNLAIVPSQGEAEYLCYEFLCKGTQGEDILVYINCETGLEEQILILLKSDGGILTI